MSDEPFQWEIDVDLQSDRVTIRVRGLATYRRVREVGGALLRHPDAYARSTHLWDLRGADLSSLRLEDLRQIWAGRAQQPHAPNVRARRALVVANDLDFAITRQSLGTGDPLLTSAFKVFKEMDTAEAWLDAEEDQ